MTLVDSDPGSNSKWDHIFFPRRDQRMIASYSENDTRVVNFVCLVFRVGIPIDVFVHKMGNFVHLYSSLLPSFQISCILTV